MTTPASRKVLVIFGTRPEAIKMAPVVQELAKYPQRITCVICVTAQHRFLLDQVLELFHIRPHVDLDIMQEDQTLTYLTQQVMAQVGQVLDREHPDLVLVQGDTTTAMVSSLTSFYRQIPVGHIEAGLRTGDRYNPFPEEMNRRIISGLATYHFAPTPMAQAALEREGVPSSQIFLTGNTIVDALYQIRAMTQMPPLPVSLEGRRVLLVTAHRRESHGPPLARVCEALLSLVQRHPDLLVLFPVHPSPAVRKTVHGLLQGHPQIALLEPLDYGAFVHLMAQAYLILTDSGGIQEEGPALGKPVLVLRENTERPEGVALGVAKLVGTDPAVIQREVERLLGDPTAYAAMARQVNPYGDGKAAQRIVSTLLQQWSDAEGRDP